MSDNKKNIMMALGAGAALIGAALVYHFVSKTDAEGEDGAVPEMEIDEEFIAAELKKAQLDVVARSAQGGMDTNYFLKLLQFVGAETRESTKERRQYLTKTRREAYKKQDWDAYTEVVRKATKEEDQAAQKILNQILNTIGISEMEFGMTHQKLAQDQQYAEFVMAAQQGKLAQPNLQKQPTLSKQETLDHLKITAAVQMQQMQTMSQNMPDMNAMAAQQNDPAAQMDMMVKMMAEQHKAQDKIFFDSGEKIENDDFEAALMHYCARDQEVAQAMQRYMSQMRGAMPAY